RWGNRRGTRYSPRRCRWRVATTRGRPGWRPRWWPRGRWGGGRLGRRRGIGMEDGAHRVPVGGGGQGSRPLLAARGARGDVLYVGRSIRRLRPRRVAYALAVSRRHRVGRATGHQGSEDELARAH